MYALIAALVLFPAIPSAKSPFSFWKEIIAFLVFGPDWPSIGPGLNPLLERNCWMSKVELITRELLSWGTHASFPALGLETAVDDASVTSPPFAVQPAWNGLTSKTDDGIRDFSTSLFTIYETSPIVIFRLGQNLSLKSLHAGITSFAASTFISFVHLLAPSSENLSIEPLRFSVDPALMDFTSKQASSSLETVSDGWIWNGLPKQTCIP